MKKLKDYSKKQKLWMLVTATLAVISAVVFILSLTIINTPPLKVGGCVIDIELYSYFLDTVRAAPKDYGLVDDSPESSIREEANKLAAEYAAVELQFKEKGLFLTTASKVNASKEMNNIWHLFGEYYKSIGIQKQTLMDIYANQAKRDTLFVNIYDEGGEKAVKESEIIKAFSSNFVAFRAFSDTFIVLDENGKNVSIPAAEKKALQTKFQNMLLDVQGGKSMDELYSAYIGLIGEALPMQILAKNEQSAYGTDFFAKVQKMKSNSVAIIESESDIHLVERDAEPSKDSEYFWQYRLQCIKALKGAEFNKQIEKDAKALELDSSESAQRRAAKAVL